MKFRYRGAVHQVPEDVAGSTAAALKEHAAATLGGDLTPAAIRVVARGKTLADEQPLSAAGSGATFLLVAASEGEISSVADEEGRQVEVASRSIARVRYSSLAARNPGRGYGFGGIRPLDGFADSEDARALLEQLANDPGILAVMRSRQWHVGVLSEMYPDGKVGVDPVCVLGLNVNKGSEIKLRLRTDDLRGFRKFLGIKKVLFHELAHNEHSEHDDAFYALMRDIESDSDRLDWRASRGRTLAGVGSGTRGHVHRGFETGHGVVGAVVGTHDMGAPTDAGHSIARTPLGAVQRLGGDRRLQHRAPPRALAGQAAIDRATAPPQARADATAPSAAPPPMAPGHAQGAPPRAPVPAAVAEVAPTGPDRQRDAQRTPSPPPQQPAPPSPQSPSRSPPPPPGRRSAPGAEAAYEDPAAALAARLRGDVQRLRRSPAQAGQRDRTVAAVTAALRNALQRGGEDPKFTRLRASNPAVQRRIMAAEEARSILGSAGWRTDDATGDLYLPPAYDPSRLYIALSVLEEGAPVDSS